MSDLFREHLFIAGLFYKYDIQIYFRLNPYQYSQVAVHLGATVSFSPPPPVSPLLACRTLRSVAHPVLRRQKAGIHSPMLISGMQRRASLPNIRKKSNVWSLSLVSRLCLPTIT